MTSCPYCGNELTVIKAGRPKSKLFEMTSWTGNNAESLARVDAPAPTFRQEPARTPSIESDVKVPMLRAMFTGLCTAACAAGVSAIAGLPKPVALTATGFVGATTLYWLNEVGELRRLMWRIEEHAGVDLDRDAHVGTPPVDNYIPVFHGPNVHAVDVPEPPELPPGKRLVLLRPSDRRIEKERLWGYLLGAFESGDWTRDGCRTHGINTKEWPAVRDFVQRWPDVWGTTDRPCLLSYLRSLGWTGPNGTGRDERDG